MDDIDESDPIIRCARSKSAIVTEEDKQLFVSRLTVTEQEKEMAQNIGQRTDEWHKFRAKEIKGLRYRIKRLTTSIFGAAAGHNDKKTSDQLLVDMLWDVFKGNEMTEYGTIMESTAFSIVEIALTSKLEKQGYDRVWLEETGITLSVDIPWIAGSGDGIIHAYKDGVEKIGNLELKCPWKREFYPTTPESHYDQFQGVSYLQKSEFIVYGIYTPTATQIEFFEPDYPYFVDTLLPLLKDFYWNQYLPCAILKERGLILEGNISIMPIININLVMIPSRQEEKNVQPKERNPGAQSIIKKKHNQRIKK